MSSTLVGAMLVIAAFSNVSTAFLQLNKSPNSVANSTMDYLEMTFKSLEKIFDFFQREYKDVNLDAVIGSRIVEASSDVLLRKLESSGLSAQIPPYILSKLHHLRDIAGDFCDKATPFIIANEPLYYSSIGPTIAKGLFDLNYESRDIRDDAVLWPYVDREIMREEDSDYCLEEIFGVRNGIPCAITNRCWTLMTKFGYSQYSLSHEIFFLEIAEGFGCQNEIQRQIVSHSQPSLNTLQNTFCANMLDEANRIAHMGYPASQQDLFMEQAALCGMLGFRDFFNNAWLLKILSWQDPKDGCYKWHGWRSDISTAFNRRQKREEKRVHRECLSHRSTVAAGALSQYVRYILEAWLQENEQ